MTVNTNRKKLPGLALMLTGIAIGVIAQVLLLLPWGPFLDNMFPLPGVFLYMLAGVLLILGMRRLGDSLPPFKVNTDDVPYPKPRLGFWINSLVLAVIIAIHATHAGKSDPDGYLFFGMWILSMVVLVFGVIQDVGWKPPSLALIKHGLKAHRAELFVVIAILLTAFLIRFVDIEWHPYSFNNDEGHMGSQGLCILQSECKNFFSLGWAAQPYPAFLAYAISIGLFGKTALAVRLISVITGTLAVLAVYLFAREVFNKKVAWLSAVLLSSLPVHVHFSRLGVDNIVDSLTTPLMLWLLFRGVKRASRLSFLAAGILAGLCIYTYPGSLLAPVFGMSALGLLALKTPGFFGAYARNILIFILAAIVVATPILGHYTSHSDLFLARFKKENILQGGRIEKQMQTSGKGVAETLLKQFSEASLVFIATDAPLNFFNSPKAYLPPLAAVICMFGLAYMFWRVKDPRCAVILIWFWGVVILGGALTGSPPTSQRILMSLPALVIMTALGMAKIIGTLASLRQPLVKFAPGILLGLMLFIGYTNLSFYFYDYRIGHYYEDPKDEITYETRIYTASLHPQGRMFLIGNPTVPYPTFESFNYFAPGMEKIRLNDIKLETLIDLPYDKDALFIALPDYKSDLDFVVQSIPGGEWHEVKRRYQPDEMLFYSYKITKERLAVFAGFPGGYDMLWP